MTLSSEKEVLPPPAATGPITGRLGQSIEGGGKRRIFAIGKYVNQRLLRPVHDWAMSVLRSIPQDGTFNQTFRFASWGQHMLLV